MKRKDPEEEEGQQLLSVTEVFNKTTDTVMQ